jgi:hypothetical protein
MNTRIALGVFFTTTFWLSASLFSFQSPEKSTWSDSVTETEEGGKSVLIIPMQGQMHTDINHRVLEPLTDRIKELNPDLILIELDSNDYETKFHALMSLDGNPLWADKLEFNGYDADAILDTAKVFHVPLKNIPQVIWVNDSAGSSTMLALSWANMYMSDEAYLRSTFLSSDFMGINAEDTRGKIREFRLHHTKVLAEWAGRDYALLRAFADPDVPLSGSWEGKKVKWEDNLYGDMVIDKGPDYMPNLSSTIAAELAISKGNANSRNDVLLAEGIREYHLVGKDITQEIEDSVTQWRKDFLKAEKMLRDGEQYGGWARGDDTARYLRKQLAEYKRLVKLLEKSQPVAARVGRKYRVSVKVVEQWIDEIEEQLKRLKDGGGSGGGRAPIGSG